MARRVLMLVLPVAICAALWFQAAYSGGKPSLIRVDPEIVRRGYAAAELADAMEAAGPFSMDNNLREVVFRAEIPPSDDL
jgi:hypothetical protein